MKFYIIAGEPSGDRLGASLIEGLDSILSQPADFRGVGGSMMIDLGLDSLFPMEEIAIMGVGEILANYRFLKKRIAQTAKAVIAASPDALITIDSPEFNLRVAELVRKKSDIPIIHYVAPTVWAWRPQRALRMAKHVDHVLALLPFEPHYMQEAGMSCDFVGHPVVEEPVATLNAAAAFRVRYDIGDAPLVLCLPGSRRSEIKHLAPIFGRTIAKLKAASPQSVIVVPAAELVVAEVRGQISKWQDDVIVLDPRDHCPDQALLHKRAAFRAADVALAASGTVSLELAANETPMVIGYDMGWLSRQIIGRMVKTDTVTLVNLVSKTRHVPEFIGKKCSPKNLVSALLKTLESPKDQLAAMQTTMDLLGRKQGSPGERAAVSVLDFLKSEKKR
jgi:lipid-A-disaccharide synthase